MLDYFYYVRDTLRTAGAPGRTRTDTGRILSPLGESLGFQNCRLLSATQSRILGILVDVYAFMYAETKVRGIPSSMAHR
jgi:hypothetical protein